eukprot:4966158-Ditylum_brightwellii.AAC.1
MLFHGVDYSVDGGDNYLTDSNENGFFPTCLIIPATNTMATFSKIGYMAFDLKKKLEKLNLGGRRVSITYLNV